MITVHGGISNVIVHVGEPPHDNPYLGEPVHGAERSNVLFRFATGRDTAGYTFWYAPMCGGAERLTDPCRVDWAGLRRHGPRTRTCRACMPGHDYAGYVCPHCHGEVEQAAEDIPLPERGAS